MNPVLRNSPPKIGKPRAADRIKSGTIDLGNLTSKWVRSAKYEAVRVFGGKPGNYWTSEACRKYAYAKKGTAGTCNLGRVDNKVIPRMYFSKPIINDSTLPMNVTERYDYDARFPLGYGAMAVDEENRIIHTWTTEMEKMAKGIWEAMSKDTRYARLCQEGNEFNHCSIHLYRKNASIKPHEDRRRNGRNSMKENTAVAVFTIGDDRTLTFRRKYSDKEGNTMTEPAPCYVFNQHEGCLFILDPSDEEHKMRRDHGGSRRKSALFVHGIECGNKTNYLSIAFVFRCLDTTALVNSATDRVIPPPPKNEKEKARRKERAAVRKNDNKQNSQFKKEVREIQQEWIRLMEDKNWL